jgi:hypothetical protein
MFVNQLVDHKYNSENIIDRTEDVHCIINEDIL